MPIPENPILFMKPRTAVIGPNADIVLPPSSERVDYEAELAVVIGRRARKVPVDEAFHFILGLHLPERRNGQGPSKTKTASGRGPRVSTRSAPSARG